MHGTFGEDGQVQQILEDRGVPYTGEGVAESELAFDKIRSKKKFTRHGVTTPPWEIIHAGRAAEPSAALCDQGAAPGIDRRRLHREGAKRSSRQRLSEAREIRQRAPDRRIHSRSRTDRRHSRRSGAARSSRSFRKSGFYDFNNKYPFLNPQGGGGAQHVCPAKIDGRADAQDSGPGLARLSLVGLEGLLARRRHSLAGERARSSSKSTPFRA